MVYFMQIREGPLAHQHRAHDTDMSFFHAWAQGIAGGDWLTNRSLHPHHYWHEQVAQAWLRRVPEAARGQSTEPGPDGSSPAGRAVWEEWWGGRRFHQEPLYPYLVALTYAALGPDVRWVFAWQALLGVGSVWLITRLARRCFGETAALVAGATAVLCSPLFFHDLTLLRTTPAVFATLALVELGDAALQRGGWRRWLAVGAASGGLMLLELKFALLGAGVGLLGGWRARRAARAAWPSGLAFSVGLSAALLPLIVRNALVGASWLSISSVGAASFACANTGGTPVIPVFTLDPERVAEIMGKTGGRMGAVMLETLRSHAGATSVVRLLARKFSHVWHWYEGPNNVNLYYAQRHSATLRVAGVSFGIIAPAALVGLVVATGQRRLSAATIMALLASLAPLLLFSVLARYRAPLMAVCIPLAACTAVTAIRELAGRRYGAAIVIGAGVAVCAAWTGRPLQSGEQLIYPFDYLTPYQYFWGPREMQAAERGDWPEAARVLEESLRYAPAVIAELGPSRPARSDDETMLAGAYERVFERLALASRNAGQAEAAEEFDRRAANLRAAQRR